MNLSAIQLALRTQALTLSAATTGSASLAATSTGYTRDSGSFVTDGFLPGMEVTPAGFGANTPRLIEAVTATVLTVATRAPLAKLTAESAAGSRSLTVSFPALRAWENEKLGTLAKRWFVEEDFEPQGPVLKTMAGTNGIVERPGLYILRFHAPHDYGMAGFAAVLDAVCALFPLESTYTAGSDTVRIRGSLGPYPSGARPSIGGYTARVVTIPWWALTLNQ